MSEVIKIVIVDNQETVVVPVNTLISNHSGLNLDDGTNPHNTTKDDIGLGSVPNTDFTSEVNANTNKVGITTTQANNIVTNNNKVSFSEAPINGVPHARIDGAWQEIQAGGTTLVPILLPTKEILATSKTQTIELSGLNLDTIETISLQDAGPINLTTDVLVISDNLIEITVTMNSTVGAKDLTINGVLIPSFIESKVNAGWQSLGSGDYSMNVGVNVIVNTGAVQPVQDLEGIKFVSNRYTSFEDLKRENDEILSIIIKNKILSSANTLSYMFLKKTTASLTTSMLKYMGFRYQKNRVFSPQSETASFFCVENNIQDTIYSAKDFPISTKGVYLRIDFSKSSMKVSRVLDQDDPNGVFLWEFEHDTNSHLTNEEFNFIGHCTDISRTETKIVKYRIS